MEPPGSLPAEARESYAHAVAAITALGDDASHYRDAIERYSLANATAELVRAEWEREGRPMVRSGSGPSRPHALLVALRDSETHAANLGAALLLDPASRARAQRAGWRKGSARAEDRQPRGLRVAK